MSGYLARRTPPDRNKELKYMTFCDWLEHTKPAEKPTGDHNLIHLHAAQKNALLRRLYAPQDIYLSILKALNNLMMRKPQNDNENFLNTITMPTATTNIRSVNIKSATWALLREALLNENTDVAYIWGHSK